MRKQSAFLYTKVLRFVIISQAVVERTMTINIYLMFCNERLGAKTSLGFHTAFAALLNT